MYLTVIPAKAGMTVRENEFHAIANELSARLGDLRLALHLNLGRRGVRHLRPR